MAVEPHCILEFIWYSAVVARKHSHHSNEGKRSLSPCCRLGTELEPRVRGGRGSISGPGMLHPGEMENVGSQAPPQTCQVSFIAASQWPCVHWPRQGQNTPRTGQLDSAERSNCSSQPSPHSRGLGGTAWRLVETWIKGTDSANEKGPATAIFTRLSQATFP